MANQEGSLQIPDDENFLRVHLGARFSCSTHVRADVKYSRGRGTSEGSSSSRYRGGVFPASSSARCLLPVFNAHIDTFGGFHASSPTVEGSLASPIDPVSGVELPLKTFFCRMVPVKSPREGNEVDASSTAVSPRGRGSARHTDHMDRLYGAVQRLYRGLHILHSPREPADTTRNMCSPDDRIRDRDDHTAGQHHFATRQILRCTRLHAGLVPLFTPLVQAEGRAILLFEYVPFRLTTLTHLCRDVRCMAGLSSTRGARGSRNLVDLVVRFVFYQLLRAVDFLHAQGITMGNLSSSNVLLTDHLWVQISPAAERLLTREQRERAPPQSRQKPPVRKRFSQFPRARPQAAEVLCSPEARAGISNQGGRHRGYRKLRPPAVRYPRQPPGDEMPLTYKWVKGMVSNLEYLLAVNAAAGRVLADARSHPVVPWVSDLTREVQPGASNEGDEAGWRDLTMTKFRLKKGDAQLDKSFAGASPPHHVPESLSELTLSVYLARKLPLQVLQTVVRSELVAAEYPPSIARMYNWTPDECVPEFYTDPSVFRSTHGDAGGLPDLEVPPWCGGSPQNFVRYHRSLLEGEHVSRNLHRWLDITFGYCLKGQAAIDNKNVPLRRSGPSLDMRSGGGLRLSERCRPGFFQLFRHPHPPREVSTNAKTTDAPGEQRREASTDPEGAERPLEPNAGVEAAAGLGQARSDTGVGSPAGRAKKRVTSNTTGKGSVAGGSSRGSDDGSCGGVANIFGVAFEDYIGEDGLRAASSVPKGVASEQLEKIGGQTGRGGGSARATIEEDRRALAFAHDVELRLEPWYGRTRDTSAGATGGRRDAGDASTLGEDASKAADLLACGCILSELCAGEPVLAVPSSRNRPYGRGGRGGSSGDWLDTAVDLPAPLRGAIRDLTHVDPQKRPSAHELLSTTEWRQYRAEIPRNRDAAGRSKQLSPLSYRGLFPPYMRDVYAFLAALHQEDDIHKRLILAAAALPVLQVPVHAFCLALPHLVKLLEIFPTVRPVSEVCPTQTRTFLSGGDVSWDGGPHARRSSIPSTAEETTEDRGMRRLRSTASSARVSAAAATNKSATEALKHAGAWVDVLDMCCERLGPGRSSDMLVPAALKTLGRLRSAESAIFLMESDLWGVLARRMGNGTFLREAFPLLIAWIENGMAGAAAPGQAGAGSSVGQDRNGESDLMAPPTTAEAVRAEGVARTPVELHTEAAAHSDAEANVQRAAAAAISNGLYDCMGPSLAARYLVPALVDCLGRLAVRAASDARSSQASAATPREGSGNRSSPLDRGISGGFAVPLGPVARVDPASRALLRYCFTREVSGEDPDAGVGAGGVFLVLSRALGEVCMMIGSEEVTVPLVTSRLFYEILPTLEPVLSDTRGTCASPTGFRCLLETVSLLCQLLPSLCPETIAHFYTGLRPASTLKPARAVAVTTPESFARMSPVARGSSNNSADLLPPSGDLAPNEEITSVPWLVSLMPLPHPLGGLDLPWSADGASIDHSQGDARNPETEGVPIKPSSQSGERNLYGGVREKDVAVVVHETDSSGSDLQEDGALIEAPLHNSEKSSKGIVAVSVRNDPCSSPLLGVEGVRGEESLGETEETAKVEVRVGVRFVCHVEVARLLGATALGVLGGDESEEEACARVLQAGEYFFAAFGRSYGGLVFASPTMTAALRLAREMHSPLASLFGFDVMHDRVPSASRRVEAWLGNDLVRGPARQHSAAATSPRNGFGSFDSNIENIAVVSEGQGHEEGEEDLYAPLPRRTSFVHEIYISPGISPRDENSISSSSTEEQAGVGAHSSMSESLSKVVGQETGQRAREERETAVSEQERKQAIDQERARPRSGGDASRTARGSGRSAAPGTKALDTTAWRVKSIRDRSMGRSRGMLAWGDRSSEKKDILLPPPTSTLPSTDNRADGNAAVLGRRPRFEPGRPAAAGRDEDGQAPPSEVGTRDAQGEEDDVDADAWPSLLGAMGSRAPRASSPPSPLPRATTTTKSKQLGDDGRAQARVGDKHATSDKRDAPASASTARLSGSSGGRPSLSPPRSPLLRALVAALPSADPSPSCAVEGPIRLTAAPLPGTCRGEGVEVTERLRDRAWLTGTRTWEARGRSARDARVRGLGDGFDSAAVGCLFPLKLVLQTSFLAYPNKAPVTSMALDSASESTLLTGSGDGEVRIWSLRDHPVLRISGFRCGDNSGGSSRQSVPTLSRPARAPVTQLAMFEGAQRAAALDGLVRVWDVERSKGLAMCQKADTVDTPPLRAFALTGSGDGITPPLHESEWSELPDASSSYSTADDQQLAAIYDGGVAYFDCRSGRLGNTVQNLYPVAEWDAEVHLETLRARLHSRGGSDAQTSTNRGDPPGFTPGLCSVCEGGGAWLAVGSRGGQVLVFDKRRAGGRALFSWNAHSAAVVGLYHVAREMLLTVSRDRTAILWDLSRSPAEVSGVDSTGPTRHHPAWGQGSYSEETLLASSAGYGEVAPVQVSRVVGLPDAAPGITPATAAMLPLGRPVASRTVGTTAATSASVFGESFAEREASVRTHESEDLPVLFAAAGDKMVASVIRRGTGDEEVYPASFIGPSGKTVGGKSSGRRSSSSGGLAIRSVSVSALRRLILLGCSDGWIRVGI